MSFEHMLHTEDISVLCIKTKRLNVRNNTKLRLKGKRSCHWRCTGTKNAWGDDSPFESMHNVALVISECK